MSNDDEAATFASLEKWKQFENMEVPFSFSYSSGISNDP